MKKRIFAWVLLAGFVLLILNLIVFRFYWQLSMVVYLIIIFAFLFSNGKLFHTQDPDKYNSISDDDFVSSDDDLNVSEDFGVADELDVSTDLDVNNDSTYKKRKEEK